MRIRVANPSNLERNRNFRLSYKGEVRMSNCQLDHSHEDVQKKYESQKEFLPEDMTPLFQLFFSKEHTQTDYNEMFHLLKKYDLSSDEEKENRNTQLRLLLKN